MLKVIEITGNMGAGKTHIASEILAKLSGKGYMVAKSSFAHQFKKDIFDYFGLSKTFADMSKKPVSIRDAVASIIGKCELLFRKLYPNQDYDINKLKEGFNILLPHILEAYQNVVPVAEPVTLEYQKSIRKILQLMGSEVVRENLSDSFWADLIASKIQQCNIIDCDYFIIDDYRFPNEDLSARVATDVEVITVKVWASDETRRKRLNVDKPTFEEMQQHSSEMYIKDLKCMFVVDNDTNSRKDAEKNVDVFLKQIDFSG